jgi:hypothetical protein
MQSSGHPGCASADDSYLHGPIIKGNTQKILLFTQSSIIHEKAIRMITKKPYSHKYRTVKFLLARGYIHKINLEDGYGLLSLLTLGIFI